MKNTLFGKNIVTVDSLKLEDIELLFARTKEMKRLVLDRGGDDRLKGKIMASLFFEPSPRTFSSFVTAMQRLGGGIIPLHGMSNTSIAKGETLPDTVRVFSHYADILVMRHPDPGSVKLAAEFAFKPVINAGDGVNEHPTQALIDLITIKEVFDRIDNLHILMIGDLAHYRPTNSLIKLLTLFPKVKLSLATPVQVPIQDNIRQYLKKKKASFQEYTDFVEILPTADVLYVTRVKKEYMSEGLYREIKGSYIVSQSLVSKMKKTSIIMHCLPRIDEIEKEVDRDSRSIYLTKQLGNSLYVRMALLDLILRE